MASESIATGKTVNEAVRKTDIMLKALETEDGLSSWEQEFITSVSDWFYEKGKPLTSKQFSILERIYRKFN